MMCQLRRTTGERQNHDEKDESTAWSLLLQWSDQSDQRAND